MFKGFITARGTGYLQPMFRASCYRCTYRINKESLGLSKLACSIVVDPYDIHNTEVIEQGNKEGYIA